ncbi:MAG: NAD-dependent protein deacetylase [Clostridia bacterium]|nr:NAD-dependent protein deacetylase [Clostridia bacterium]
MRKDFIQLKEYIDNSHNAVAVTGAGISYLYGMRRLKMSVGRMNAGRIFSADYVRKHPEDFYAIMRDSFLDATFVKGPSKVHLQLAELEKQGKLCGIVTQNLDCLHTIAGSKNVAEFQGSFQDNVCVDCGAHYTDYNIWNQGHMPRCTKCGAPIMPATFCRNIRSEESQAGMRKAIRMIADADLVIIIGTTGFRSDEYMSGLKRGTKIVQINPAATEFDSIADLNVRADAAEALSYVLGA